MAEYFFDSPVECCAAFYSSGGEPSSVVEPGEGSDGTESEGKECIIEDVCLDTPTGYPLYYLDLDDGKCIQQLDDGEGMINLFNTLEECVSIAMFCFVLLCIH